MSTLRIVRKIFLGEEKYLPLLRYSQKAPLKPSIKGC